MAPAPPYGSTAGMPAVAFFECCAFKKAEAGGGGGSRTPVRENDLRGAYMFIPCLYLIRRFRADTGLRTSLFVFSDSVR